MGRYEDLAGAGFEGGFATDDTVRILRDELVFQRAVQAYLWSLPAVNIWAMKEASERQFGGGYHVLPVWQDRIDAKTLVTTPNFDVVYAMGYLDLDAYGPLVVEAPAGVQGIIDDFWQRPILGPTIDGHQHKGDVGLVGPDAGRGGTYVLLPPDYQGPDPDNGFIYRSRTNNVFLFWRSFFTDPDDLTETVDRIEATIIYPLGGKDAAAPMEFPHASGVELDMLFPRDGRYFDMLDRFIQAEAVDPHDMDMRGFLHTLGIEKGRQFTPTAHDRELLDRAARIAFAISKITITNLLPFEPGGTYFPNQPWLNVFAGQNTEFQASGTFTNLEQRAGYFTSAYSDSPGMVVNLIDEGAKYPVTMRDGNGDWLDGARSYTLTLPAGIPAKLFWSVAVYDPITASGLDNGQRFPSINAMDKPDANPDGSHTIHFGPDQPADAGEKNWLRTVPGKGFFVIVRLYGPGKPFFEQTWIPGNLTPA
ncbi:DUF1254 domain-containing protein [Nocardia cerradoensis]|uniref:DUF1254 domain-containing protein n=1 Tax=Nocardia cerradoensis TaxID=85688 RepID=UPI0005856B9A|nr:DUF1254 domain-containing protein [Nocardia cerradoensis]NKY48456.1 DUF1254 domain-containing protein [Nocardia cerradoensis]